MKKSGIKRRSRGAQLPSIIPLALEALRAAAGLSSWEAVENEIDRRERRHPEFGSGSSSDTWRNLVKNDGTLMPYVRLELLEGVTGIPTGVILDVSGSMALLRNGDKKAEALRYASGLRQLADEIEREARQEQKLDKAAQKRVMENLYRVWKTHGVDLSMPLRTDSAQ